ncbi:MAG TPA: metal ABC transporter substrate-binding protein [Candidatus Bipolaricaulis sp.]|nr:metal ABC transporter substrate-binding protein [Candidatus Bipolaricaulis sp.]HRS14051.1 metal ABC transporter substrate-binding protein [Candidatus Bipolaricaulis sp.]HRU21876.1 metal ABC transporter substrate-binding protein [Candidatus Bipolaricaulis sp.]
MPAAKWFLGVVIGGFSLASLGAPVAVVATTSIVGDVVQEVGGERVALVVLFPPGTDPHTFEPTPQDLVALSRADAVFIAGAGLEEGLARILSSPELQGKVVDLSAGLPLRALAPDGAHGGTDPHVWFDPLLVAEWTRTIESALGRLDPPGKEEFAARAAAYREELAALDRWIQEQVAVLPPARRVLITDHWALGYFADRYGFIEGGAIIPALSTLAEPSARDRAILVDRIRSSGVPAVFVSPEFNPDLASELARDTGVRVVVLFQGSLSAPDGPAPDYLSFMRENVRRIVEALRG